MLKDMTIYIINILVPIEGTKNSFKKRKLALTDFYWLNLYR